MVKQDAVSGLCRLCAAPTLSKRARYCDRCRPRKYGARVTYINGKRFASKKEADRYGVLLSMAEAGDIGNLACQHRFPIAIDSVLICVYVADFYYYDFGFRKYIVEDVKSKFTAKNPVYRIKKKLMKAVYNINVQEIS